ncbi:MAG: hypothetical protein E7256_12100 [Lachnospiraceae bacterium]|nr:hypothetical protein [Lachnospiraceae bacterium]
MKKTLMDFKKEILSLPLKAKYEKAELLKDAFLLEREGNIEIFYAPHNEYINPDARIFIVGITPGFQQMNDAIAAARKGMEEGHPIAEIQYECKRAARFSGSMRRNMIQMLDEVGVNEYLDLKSCTELFENRDDLLHTVSLIPYSVFVKGGNYTGHTPKLLKSEFLMKYVYENFVTELGKLHNPDVLIVPLGKAVEEALGVLVQKGIVKEDQILYGFPHPSGANGNRLIQLKEGKDAMKKILKDRKQREAD